ncbi:uncharacterized protein LOC102681269 [Apis dorsata]|uniref:uncharacterized protein LOC102681269 n=1 Tax=Apis dorsata TaxID=7462 RepID=UPI001293B056|nr:uncharacterized protein LOC102681269 [Apis dorsata]
MSSSPDGRKAPPPRLKIQLPLPGQYYPQTGMGYVSTPYGQTPMPMTPVSGQPQMLYANKASEFVFSQFKGIKDLTKSGLSVGEKSAFWLYEKVCVISIGGAMIFVTIEGTNEEVAHGNIRKERDKTLITIRELCNDQVLATNSDLWNGRARNELMKYEEHLYDYFKRGLSDHEQKVWTFWNAVFYCGTIYTTIES